MSHLPFWSVPESARLATRPIHKLPIQTWPIQILVSPIHNCSMFELQSQTLVSVSASLRSTGSKSLSLSPCRSPASQPLAIPLLRMHCFAIEDIGQRSGPPTKEPTNQPTNRPDRPTGQTNEFHKHCRASRRLWRRALEALPTIQRANQPTN